MEKSSFYDIDYSSERRDSTVEAVKNINEDVLEYDVSDAIISSEAPRQK